MTVSYQSDVASSTSGGLIKLLWRWRGSVWKLVYRELVLFLVVYLSLALSYDFLFSDYYKRYYEKVVIFCSAFVDMIPLSFILGFYVSFTAGRWWNQYIAIPWPDKIMNNIAMYIPGQDETSRILRRTLMRYLNLSLVLVLRSISIAVKRRFPTKEHLVEAGFMTKPELEMYSSVPSTEFNTFWIPCTWFVNLLREARQECRITDSSGLKLIMEEFNEFRNKCGLLWSYDWVSIPLVYTQVVTIATYAFFIASVFGRQHVNPPEPSNLFLGDIEHRGEFYIPVFSILQFLLYMGLLKLGEQLINPFGDDDEDFEMNWIIDRHIKVSFLGVDVLNSSPPPLMKDNYFDEMDIKLPYTAAAVSYKKKTYRGSMAAYHVPSEQQGLVVPEFDEDDEDDNNESTLGTTLQAGSKGTSVWSVFGGKLTNKYAGSASLISLDSENLDAEGNASDTWQGSSMSFIMSQEDSLGQQQGPTDVQQEITRKMSGTSIAGRGAEEPGDKASQGIRGRETRDSQLKLRKASDGSPGSTRGGGGGGRGSGGVGDVGREEGGGPGTPVQAGNSGPPTPPTGGPPTLDIPFDPTGLGMFFAKHGPEGDVQSRRTSGTSLSRTSSEQRLSLAMRGSVSPGAFAPNTPTTTLSRSSSSASKKLGAVSKTPKPALLKFRKADPRLKIRPFRSKVTFSDDTKDKVSLYHVRNPSLLSGQATEGIDLTISSPELSEADLLNAYLNKRDETARQRSNSSASTKMAAGLIHPLGHPHQLKGTIPKREPPSSEDEARRLSFDQTEVRFPSELIAAIGLPSEYWLRHQSLPNIQEIVGEEGSSGSPTRRAPSPRVRLLRRLSSDRTSDRTKLLTKQRAADEPSPPKESQGDPGLAAAALEDPANDKRRRYSGTGGQTSLTGQRRYKKRSATSKAKAPKQSSTESESSYAPAQSVFVQISEEAEEDKSGRKSPQQVSTSSSIASYSSARDMFGRPSIDGPIPTIVVLQTTPTNSELNIASDGQQAAKPPHDPSDKSRRRKRDSDAHKGLVEEKRQSQPQTSSGSHANQSKESSPPKGKSSSSSSCEINGRDKKR